MNHRIARHEFACSAISSAFRVVGFTGTEAISQPYRFEIELVSDDPEIDFSDVIDQPATLTMYRGDDPSEVDGIVTSLQQLHQTGAQSEFRYGYRAVLEPRLSRLTFSMQSRVFQNRTVEEIVTQILDEAGVDVEFDLKDSYAPREYTTQYKETDLAFVQRLLEFEGIHYAFRHEDGAETLVVSDDAKSATPIEGDPEIAYSHADGLRPSDSLETIRDFVLEQRLVTGMTRVKDYNYRTPEANVFSENELEAKGSTGVHSDYGVHAKDTDAADRLSKIRAEEIESQRVTVTGTGDCLRFRAGQTFSLRDHYRDGLNQTYLITSVQHTGAQPDTAEASVADEALPNYSNAFTCIPASAPFRPPRLTPEPKLPGVMTAKVESGGGDYAYIDDEGRYRVKMPFDLADAEAGGASKPIRLAQPYTGAGYGMHFPVHADAEMVFACVDGNVDRPLGLSTVPNPSQGSPVTSENRSRNSIITSANNRIELDDDTGNERIKLYTPYLDSVLQIGSPNQAVQGNSSLTRGLNVLHGEKGVLLSAWPYSDDLGLGPVKGFVDVLDAAATVAITAGKISGVGGFSWKPTPWNITKLGYSVFGKGNSASGALTGSSLPLPNSTLITSPRSIKLVSPDSIKLYSGLGIKLISSESVETLTSKSFSVAAIGGIGLYAGGNNDFRVLAEKSVSLTAKSGDTEIDSFGSVKILSHTESVNIKSESQNHDINITSDRDIISRSVRDISYESNNDINIKSSNDLLLSSENGSGAFVSKNELILGSESGSVNIKAAKGSLGIPGLTVESGYGKVQLDHHLRIQVGNPPGGPQIDMYAGGSMSFRSGSNRITMSATGITIDAISLDLSAKAIASLKGAITKAG